MHLSHGEEIKHVIRRHKTPYLFKMVGIIFAAIPVYGLVILIGSAISNSILAILFAAISFIFGMVVTIVTLDYFLDQLIVTNRRVILVDWKNIFNRVQDETKFDDIQDIETHENGILARFRLFDYGNIGIETAASQTTIFYRDCPDPEGVKHKIFEELAKHREEHHEKGVIYSEHDRA